MAAKKAAPTKAVATKSARPVLRPGKADAAIVETPVTGSALVRREDRWAAEAAKAAEVEKTGGKFLSIRAGKLKYEGNEIKGGELNVVVLDSIFENAYYGSDFDPDAPTPPVCYAFARQERDLAPHADAEDKQHSQCQGCPKNVFGTAEKGKGKACKNIRRLALLPADDLTFDNAGTLASAFLKLPVTSVKAWGAYVNSLNSIYRRPPSAVVTRIIVESDEDVQVKVSFVFQELLDGDLYDALEGRRAEVAGLIDAPYPAASEMAAAAPQKAIKGQRGAKAKPAPRKAAGGRR